MNTTKLVSCPQSIVAAENAPFVPPVFQSVSFTLEGDAIWERTAGSYSYSSSSNPTCALLERTLAELQKQEAAILTSTGKSAMAQTLLALLRAGDHVLMFKEAYKSTRHFIERILMKFGVELTILPLEDLAAFRTAVRPGKTKLLLLESPTNPMTRVCDLRAFCALAKEHGLITILDNSIAGLHNHGDAPVDLFVHSLSKYGTGVGDVMGGAIIGKKELVQRIRSENLWNAEYMDASVAAAIQKGLHTYFLRIARQTSSALAVAQALEEHPAVTRVLYPGLPSHPDHAVAVAQMRDFGTILAFDIGGGQEELRLFIDALQLFKVTAGTGYSRSIVNPAKLFYAKGFPERQEGAAAIHDTTVRLSIGLEEPEDLIEDLQQALESAF